MIGHSFRHKDRDYVVEFPAQHPLYAGMWGVREPDSVEYIVVRRSVEQALRDAIHDIDSFDNAMNRGFEAMFNPEGES